MGIAFTDAELTYLRGQRLGRLATVDAAGAPQNNPVGFFIDDARGQLIIAGTTMGKTRKYRNVRGNPYVSLVVDDLASTDPWQVRGVEVRGTAETQDDVDPPMDGLSREVIRITPRWIGSWGITADQQGFTSRGTQAAVTTAETAITANQAVQDAVETNVRRLIDGYFRGFDERRCNDVWLASIFSDDVVVRFPAAELDGRTGLSALHQRILSLWAATLHQTSNYQVRPIDGGAEFTAVLTATHVHRPDDPGAHLRIGAHVSGSVRNLPQGWRIRRLMIDLVWTEGDGPTPVERGAIDSAARIERQ
jgi:pyridoxamine 5'-phosphate oxidase family protein